MWLERISFAELGGHVQGFIDHLDFVRPGADNYPTIKQAVIGTPQFAVLEKVLRPSRSRTNHVNKYGHSIANSLCDKHGMLCGISLHRHKAARRRSATPAYAK